MSRAMLRLLPVLLALLILTSFVLPARAQINMWEDEEGVLILDSRRTPHEKPGLIVTDESIQTRPMPAGTNVDEFHRVYKRGTDELQKIAALIRQEDYTSALSVRLVPFKNYIPSKAPDLVIPPGVQQRIDAMEGVSRVSRNMIEGQRDPQAVDRLKSKALYCNGLVAKLRWDVWIKTYQAPIDIAELDETICLNR
ncbi:hypothetical protein [Oceanidesulfovibrio marinus]|uniref:DUF4124 domain-containing protein n=1 Tax=Oceanidesulfovibrio marinus TaxID=370038 RepID=A0A6P1ZKW1_9BACT|nr:hypothetical protein [Oceanidesulfovibrio marinus]TVM36423.1 hypothetical protein DQK91_00420 [Oceanidesulfovibrio marinus]